MAINSVEPRTSKVTGGVIIDIAGTGFEEPQTDTLLTVSNSTDTSSSGGLAEYLLPDGVSFSLPAQINERASIQLTELSAEVFDLELFFTSNVRSFPLLHDAKALGIEVIDQTNTLNKIRLFLHYQQTKGYLLVIETWNGLSLVQREERSFDPNDIDSFRVKGCGKYIHGYVKSQGQYIHFGKSSELDGTSYSVALFTESPTTGVAVESGIDINRVLRHRLVSFAGYPLDEISWTDTAIRGTTVAGELSTGSLILSTASGTNYTFTETVAYAKGIGAAFISKQFDTVQAITNEYVNPPRDKLFSSSDGFTWDEDSLLSESNKNNNLFVPSLWDPSTGNIPRSFFQSGAGPFDALKFKGIKKFISEDKENWYAQINHGTYFIANVPYYLFSDESVIKILGELKREDGRSYQPLLFRPKTGIPMIASSLGEDTETGKIIERKRFQKRETFSGIVSNGVELDVSRVENIDQSKNEFVVTYNENNEVINYRVPVEGNVLGTYVFQLPKIPLKEFKVRFSRIDIFKTEKTIAKTYNSAEYNAFPYGEGVTELGDYAIDFVTGEVEVIIDRTYTDMGFVSYAFDYPAIVEFNNDYVQDTGSDLITPTFRDLKKLDNLGSSDGQPAQKFRLHDFPIVDYSSFALLDTYNFKLFIYDEYDNSFDGDWTRVSDFNESGPLDKVYKMDPSSGVVRFGDNLKGKIPPKYTRILAGYKPTVKIQFEPRSSNDCWSGKAIDLNLTKQNINSGFLYLNRKDLIPSSIDLEFAAGNISVYQTADLVANVFTQDNEVVPGELVNFEITAGSGFLQEESLLTNSDGNASTIYIPSSKLQDIGIKVDLYEAGVDEDTLGAPKMNSYSDQNGILYRGLRASELIQGDIEDIYLFRILDDGDEFLPYNRETRRGGRLVLYHELDEPVRADVITGNSIEFLDQLPQPFDEFGPNYEPDLRGFYIVGKKTIQARAFIEIEESKIFSEIVSLTVEYSPLQKGTWTLPTPPLDYESSQIDTATYISID